MTEHRNEFAQLRVGAGVTLRDWRGDSVKGVAFLSPSGQWLARCASGAVFPVVPRELVAVADGADAAYARLQEGATVTLADWEGGKITGRAHQIPRGIWECKAADGARWLIEAYRIISIEPANGSKVAA